MVTVGIDPHKRTHTAVAIDERGGQVGKPITVPDEPAAIARLLAWAHRLAPGQPLRWAIEDGRGLARRLADGLVAAGQDVVWVPVRLVAAKRRRGAARGKSDPIDALASAKAAQDPDNHKYLAPVGEHPLIRQIRHLADAHADKVTRRTQIINTLRWRCHELDPDLAPATLTTLQAPRQLGDRLRSWPTPNPITEVAIADCAELIACTEAINALRRRLADLLQPLCPTLLAICGVGPIVAARLIGHTGDITRIRCAAAFARINATAPIPVWSSNHEQHRLDPGGNRALNNAIHTAALTQRRVHPPAQRLYQAKLPTKGSKGAMRVLKRHLSDRIYEALNTDIKDLTLTATTSQHTAA